ncbi:MAG: Mur ligase family protein [Candidatus Uhrbacteria bacterium]|nr:Mur ligase family protein [Candidatus Uhrbacteria bacterium]
MKALVMKMIQNRAKAILAKFKPKVIAITGSIGKTSTKEAIALVLKDEMSVRVAKKNYNNEFGVPLTILGEVSPGKSIMGWLGVLFRSYSIKSFPDVLILEFGADHPGDIEALCELAPPSVGVITGLSNIHAEFFESSEALAEEKSQLAMCLPSDGIVVLNADDHRVSQMSRETKALVRTFGIKSDDISMSELRISTRRDEEFDPGELFAITSLDVMKSNSKVGELKLRNCLGYAPAMACLAAITVADALGVSIDFAITELNREFQPSPGRLNPIAGIKGSLIIDDSYNAAPAAMINGLDILKIFSPGEEQDRRIAALGSMAELGQYSDQEHRQIGFRVAEVADVFIAVGENMRIAVESAKEAGMHSDSIEWFATSEEAGRYLDRFVQQGDIVYTKGSQSSRMEKVVKELMAEPLRAEELLVRQGENWQKS